MECGRLTTLTTSRLDTNRLPFWSFFIYVCEPTFTRLRTDFYKFANWLQHVCELTRDVCETTVSETTRWRNDRHSSQIILAPIVSKVWKVVKTAVRWGESWVHRDANPRPNLLGTNGLLYISSPYFNKHITQRNVHRLWLKIHKLIKPFKAKCQ